MKLDRPTGLETLRGQTPMGVWVESTTSPHTGLLDLFYDGYNESFVLANEKEELQGFAECLAFNDGIPYEQMAARFGPYKEVILVAREAQDGDPFGGANLIAYLLDRGQKLALNLNYLYVRPAHRRKGHFRRLVDTVGHVARAMFELPNDVETWIFIEQNDPIRMSTEDYARDTEYSGLDQVERLTMWASLGARIVDFPYVQPPLSPAQEPDENLIYSVLGVAQTTLSARLFLAHLERFFSISVLKGRAIESCSTALRQLEQLRSSCATDTSISLLDPRPAIAFLRAKGDRHLPNGVGDMRALTKEIR